MAMNLTLSLIIPSYRRGEKIGQTLESVYAQTRFPDEILIVNDGGFPETTAFVSRHFPMARVLDIPHGGAPAARNHGAAAARSSLLMFLDDDDTLRPHAAETLLGVLTKFPQARAGYADHTYTNRITGEYHANHHAEIPSFGRLKRIRPLGVAGDTRSYGKALYYALLKGNLLQQPWVVYRDTYLHVGGYQLGLGSADDWDLYLRLTRLHTIALSDEVVGNHFVEEGRPHLTLAAGQRETQMEAIRRQIRLAGWKDPQAVFTLRRRLAVDYKAQGDQFRRTDLAKAWYSYARSFLNWPFDHVVAARLLTWPAKILPGRRPLEAANSLAREHVKVSP
jgi:glycosyltransferase involved in cell wall biosynthesis